MNAVLSAASLYYIRFTFLWYRNTNRDEASGILFEVKTADTGCLVGCETGQRLLTGEDELLAAGYSSLQEAIGAAGGRGGLMKRTRGCRGQIMILTD